MEEEKITIVPLSVLHPHPKNAEYFSDADDEALERLKESIAVNGLLTPLRISKNYTIISGHQRYKACKELGVQYVQVIIDEELVQEEEMLMQLIASNFGRVQNDPGKQGKMIEEYERLVGITHGGDRSGNNFRFTQDDLAKQFGITARMVRNYKAFSHMSEEVQDFVRTGKLTMTAAQKVLSSLTPDEQLEVLSSFGDVVKKITQAELDARVKEMFSKAEESEKARQEAIKKEDEARIAQYERQQELLEKATLTAQTKQEEAETETKRILAQQEEAEKRLADLTEQVEEKQHELDDLRSQIDEVEDADEEPEVVYPDDYEKLKRMEKEFTIVKQELASLKAAAAAAPSEKDPHYRNSVGAPEKVDNSSSEIMWQFIEINKTLVPLLDRCVSSPGLLSGMTSEAKKSFIKQFTSHIQNFTTAIRQMEAK